MEGEKMLNGMKNKKYKVKKGHVMVLTWVEIDVDDIKSISRGEGPPILEFKNGRTCAFIAANGRPEEMARMEKLSEGTGYELYVKGRN
jgi:hypothetical protein